MLTGLGQRVRMFALPRRALLFAGWVVVTLNVGVNGNSNQGIDTHPCAHSWHHCHVRLRATMYIYTLILHVGFGSFV